MDTSAYDDLIRRATADEAVRGLVLSGSQARGLATEHSDFDVYVIVDEPAAPWAATRKVPGLDEIVMTVADLTDTSVTWHRYSFRGARVLLDRLDGRIAELVERQATPTPAEATAWSREFLDGYVNQIYRAAKCRRDGLAVPARLDEAESVSWLLATVFALHGRLRPYNRCLRWELETFPLGEPWDAGSFPERVAADPAGLFADVERLARARGHGDVLDAWGDDLGLLHQPRI